MSAPPREPDLRLRHLRESTGVSMACFARKVGCEYGHLGQIERGARRPSPALAYRIAQALTELLDRPVSPDEFFTRRQPRRAA